MLVDVKNLHITFDTFMGPVEVIRGNYLSLQDGEVLGIVGESGSGKSVTAHALMGLLPIGKTQVKADSFQVLGHDCASYQESDWRPLRGSQVAMVFQDPMTALNPILTIGKQLREVLAAPEKGQVVSEKDRLIALLEKVGISDPAGRLQQYPHELSGGMRQRVVIAMALAGNPRLIIADEPTTALDVTTEAQIVRLLRTLVDQEGIGLIFISHNLRVVAQLCDRIMVMYGGQCVEEGPCEAIINHPRHPYTQGLLASLPQGKAKGQLVSIGGEPPDVYHWPKGCTFSPRCNYCMNICVDEAPQVEMQGQNQVACWLGAARRVHGKEEIGHE